MASTGFPAAPPPRPRRPAFAALLLGAALLVGVGLGLGLALGGAGRGWLGRTTSEQRATTVVERLRDVVKLATVEAYQAQVVRIDERSPFLAIFESRKTALLVVRGRVLAGVDLERARLDIKVEGTERWVEVTLPRAEVLAVDPTVEFYDERAGWLTPITPADRTQWLAEARAELVRAALATGLRARSEARARELLGGVAEALGYRVRFTGPGAASSAPPLLLPTPAAERSGGPAAP